MPAHTIQQISHLLDAYEQGHIYPVIDANGLHWRPTRHGGLEDALPHTLVLIACAVQNFIDRGPAEHGIQLVWHINTRTDRAYVIFAANYREPLDQLGLNADVGFFNTTRRPDLLNLCDINNFPEDL